MTMNYIVEDFRDNTSKMEENVESAEMLLMVLDQMKLVGFMHRYIFTKYVMKLIISFVRKCTQVKMYVVVVFNAIQLNKINNFV